MRVGVVVVVVVVGVTGWFCSWHRARSAEGSAGTSAVMPVYDKKGGVAPLSATPDIPLWFCWYTEDINLTAWFCWYTQ